MLLLCSSLYSLGSRETGYESTLSQTFSELSLKVSTGELSVAEAQAALDELRRDYRVPFTDTSGVLEVLLYRIAEGELTADEAQSLFAGMNSGGKVTRTDNSRPTGGSTSAVQTHEQVDEPSGHQTNEQDNHQPDEPVGQPSDHTDHEESPQTSPAGGAGPSGPSPSQQPAPTANHRESSKR